MNKGPESSAELSGPYLIVRFGAIGASSSGYASRLTRLQFIPWRGLFPYFEEVSLVGKPPSKLTSDLRRSWTIWPVRLKYASCDLLKESLVRSAFTGSPRATNAT